MIVLSILCTSYFRITICFHLFEPIRVAYLNSPCNFVRVLLLLISTNVSAIILYPHQYISRFLAIPFRHLSLKVCFVWRKDTRVNLRGSLLTPVMIDYNDMMMMPASFSIIDKATRLITFSFSPLPPQNAIVKSSQMTTEVHAG